MSETSQPDRPIELDVLYADDALLDALGQGRPAPAGDGLAVLLAAWRADLATDGGADDRAAPAPALAATGAGDRAEAEDGAEAEAEDQAEAGDQAEDERRTGAEVVPIRRVRPRHRVRLAVAAAALAAIAGGTGVAAAQATPGSPLWPLTHLVNPGRADVLDAQAAIDDARRAVTEGRTADALRLVDKADKLISHVQDPGEVTRLRAELADVRRLLTAAGVAANPSGVTSPTPAPGTGSSTGTGTGGTGQPGQTPGPTGTGRQTGGPVVVPSLPVPTSVPPILPSLPIPHVP
jgi:hypothetical protein